MNLQLEWTEDDLLATDAIAEPLIVGGVRCHGGFDDGGDYHSPRTRNRVPAIEAWQRNHTATFGTELIDVPLSTWPETYPNVDQAQVPRPRGRARADHHDAHAHRHRRGIRGDDPLRERR